MDELTVCNAPDGAWSDPVFQMSAAPTGGSTSRRSRGWIVGVAVVVVSGVVSGVAVLRGAPQQPPPRLEHRRAIKKVAGTKVAVAKVAARPASVSVTVPAPVRERAPAPAKPKGAMPEP